MSIECLRVYSRLNKDDIQTKLAIHCSPVLAGIKISNLIVVKKQDIKSIYKLFIGTKISVFVLCVNDNSASILLYRKELLEEYLMKEDVISLLGELGYFDLSLYDLLIIVRKKYLKHSLGCGVFPHELGIVLGYPPYDVKGFMENQGKNYRLCGYWKVYDHVEEATKLFHLFDKAKEKAVNLLAVNKSLLELMEVS